MPFIPKSLRNLGVYGLIRQAEVDDNLIPDGAVTDVNNFHFDRKGASTVRLGITRLGGTISSGNPCLGIFNVQAATAIAAFVSGGSLTIFSLTSSTWNSSLTGTGGSTQARFADFTGRTVFVSGLERSIRAWTGSADGTSYWDTSGSPINAQQLWYVNSTTNTGYIRPKYIEVYKSRVFLSGDSANADRLYFSSVVSSTGVITWSPAVDFVDINPNDGENITAIKRYSLELLIFKPNYIYRFRSSAVDPDPLIKVGTRSQESVVEGKRGLYFHHDTGFYRYSGGYPEEISRPISDYINNITFANYSNIAGWRDFDHIYWHVGNISVTVKRKTVTLNNVVVVYSESSDSWTIYSYAPALRRGADFNNTSSLTRIVGTDNGVVSTFNSGNTDMGEPVSYYLVTKWYDWGQMHRIKNIRSLLGITEKALNSQVFYQVDDDDETWFLIGTMSDFITHFRNLNVNYNRIRFKVGGVNSSDQPVFLGMEITDGQD